MSFVYIYEQKTKIGFEENQFILLTPDEMQRSIPVECLEGVVLFGQIEVTSRVINRLMEYKIPLTWLSSKGKFFGRLESTESTNIQRQRIQFRCGENKAFRLEIGKQFIKGKIQNQKVYLRRCNRTSQNREVEIFAKQINAYIPKIENAKTMEELMDYEGTVARYYFQSLAKLMPEAFSFKGRSKRPPRDPFNSLLSFGYTLLLYDIHTIITNFGLNVYAGFLHKDRKGHPSLASDLMEEWRSVLIDPLVVSLIHKGMIQEDQFDYDDKQGGVYTDKKAARTLIQQYTKKTKTLSRYINEIERPISFKKGMEHQIQRLIQAMEEEDPSIYQPIVLR